MANKKAKVEEVVVEKEVEVVESTERLVMEGDVVSGFGHDFSVIKTGRDQASQALGMTRWLAKYGLKALQEDDKLNFEDGMIVLEVLTERLTVDAVIELFAVMLGCTKGFANKHFDISILLSTLVKVYESQPAFREIIARFF